MSIDALRKVVEAATKDAPLPWEWDGRRVIGPGHTYVPQGSSLGPTLIQLGDTYENHGAHCDLVADAVNALPALLACAEAAKEVAELDSDTPEHARLRTALEAIR